MLNRILKLTIVVVFALTGLILTEYLLPYISDFFGYDLYDNGFFGIALATIVLMMATPAATVIATYTIHFNKEPVLTSSCSLMSSIFTERMAIVLSKVPTSDILVMTLGIGIGLILANLLGGPFSHLPIIGPYIPLIFSLVLSIIGAKVALRKHKDIVGFFNRSIPSLKGAVKPAAVKSLALSDRLYSKNKLLDTSVIIDGRIIDILKTGFLEGRLIVPNFVLEELQKLADSSDNLKRAKGRRGLDLIQEIQQKNKEQLLVEDTDFEDLNEVDAKLVKLAKQTEAVIITNDFNLNKVAEIQGVSVLNINDLANAIKPVVLPGEEMNVFVVKDGKENNQGVAYLEDGTMIVVEGGKKLVGENTAVVVTSVLQTSAGRMIFAKLK